MRYLHSFKKFKLILEKINKDEDYYRARLEQMEKPILSFLSKMIQINKKWEKSGGMNPNRIAKVILPKIVDAFIESLTDIYTFSIEEKEQMQNTVKGIIRLNWHPDNDKFSVTFFNSGSVDKDGKIEVPESLRFPVSSRKNATGDTLETGMQIEFGKGFEKINMALNDDIEKESKNFNLLLLQLGKLFDRSSEYVLKSFSSESIVSNLINSGKELPEIMEETGLSKEKVNSIRIEYPRFKEELRELLKKRPGVFTSWKSYYEKIAKQTGFSTEQVIEFKAKDMLIASDGKNIDQIIKETGLSGEKIKELWNEVETKRLEAQDEQPETQDKVEDKTVGKDEEVESQMDPLAKKITDWGKVIENFRKKAKETFKISEEWRQFDIDLDKFAEIVKKSNYDMKLKKIDNDNMNYIESICKPVLNSFMSSRKKGVKSNLNTVFNFYFMQICKARVHGSYGKWSGNYSNIIVSKDNIITNGFELNSVLGKTADIKGFTINDREPPSTQNPIFVEKLEDIKVI